MAAGTPELEREGAISVRLPYDNAVRLETPNYSVEIAHADAGSGFSWNDSRALVRQSDVLEVSGEGSDPVVFLQLPLTGRFCLTTPDGIRLTERNAGLTRPVERWGRYHLEGGTELRLFGANVSLKALSDWFGGSIPEALRPLVSDRTATTVHCPTPIPRAVEDGLRLALSYADPLRRIAVEGAVLQLVTSCLHHMCGNSARDQALSAREEHAALAARERLLADLANPPTVAGLAREIGLSVRRLDIAFRERFGMSVHEALTRDRFAYACEALLQGMPVKTVAFQLGYAHASNFTYAFRKRYGLSPSQWVATKGV